MRSLAIVCLRSQNASSAKDAQKGYWSSSPQPPPVIVSFGLPRHFCPTLTVLCGFKPALWLFFPRPLSLSLSLCPSHTLHTPLFLLNAPASLAIATGQMRRSCLSSEHEQWSVMSTSFVEARRAKQALFISLNHAHSTVNKHTHVPLWGHCQSSVMPLVLWGLQFFKLCQHCCRSLLVHLIFFCST